MQGPFTIKPGQVGGTSSVDTKQCMNRFYAGTYTQLITAHMMIVLLLFLQKQSLAFAVYLFGIGTLHTGPGLKKKSTCDNALTMTSPVHW